MHDVVIVDAARSPVGKKNGSLGGAHPTDVLGQVMMKVLERNQLDSAVVDQIVGGCINKLAAQGMNVTRTAWLAHGGAESTPCITIDSQCGSSQEATTLAHSILAAGHADVVMACGVENMTRLPIGSDAVGRDAKMGKPVSSSYFAHHELPASSKAPNAWRRNTRSRAQIPTHSDCNRNSAPPMPSPTAISTVRSFPWKLR